MSAAKPMVLEMRHAPDRVWWVLVLSERDEFNRSSWTWTRRRTEATVFPTKRAAERFRVDECLRFLSGYERRALRPREAS